jgi:hypothetical protein
MTAAQKSEVVTIEHSPSVALTPRDMLNQAVERGANIDVLTKLMDLQERWEKNQARKEFDAAIAAAKAEISPVVRNATGHNSKRYADFAAIARAVDPVITKHGLSYRFRTAQTDRIAVTCVLSHRAGHSEETTLAGPPDASGSKNAIQAIGSTLTYLQRYSLVQALGLAAGDDDDGRRADTATGPISAEQVKTLEALFEKVGGDRSKTLKYFKIAELSELPASEYDRMVAALNKKLEGGAK